MGGFELWWEENKGKFGFEFVDQANGCREVALEAYKSGLRDLLMRASPMFRFELYDFVYGRAFRDGVDVANMEKFGDKDSEAFRELRGWLAAEEEFLNLLRGLK